VDIAWDAGQFSTLSSDDVWGWSKAASNTGACILDCAVQTGGGPSPGGNPHLGPWLNTDLDMAFEVIGVPEPSTVVLLALGLLGACFATRRRTH
jgi:hypothetical protein